MPREARIPAGIFPYTSIYTKHKGDKPWYKEVRVDNGLNQ